MKRVGLALDRQQCFGHGQIYVAFSRVSRMSGIKVYNTTGSAPNRILNIVCKEILDPHDRDKEKVESNNIQHPSVVPEPAYAQTTMDNFITTRDPSNGAKDCMPPHEPWCGPDIDCGPDFVPLFCPNSTTHNSLTNQNIPTRTKLDNIVHMDSQNDDKEVNDNEQMDIDDICIDGGVIPRMPKCVNIEFDDNIFTTSCPPIIVSQSTKNKSPQRFNDDEIMIDEPSTSAANKSGKPDLLDRDTLRQEPIEKRKAVKTGDNPTKKKQSEIQLNDFERSMIGDGNCFFR